MNRYRVPGLDGTSARVTAAADGTGIVVELFGPKGGYLAGIGIAVDAAPAMVRALRKARVDAITIVTRPAPELVPDSVVRCRECRSERRAFFADCIGGEWPTCCGATMELLSTEADAAATVAEHLEQSVIQRLPSRSRWHRLRGGARAVV